MHQAALDRHIGRGRPKQMGHPASRAAGTTARLPQANMVRHERGSRGESHGGILTEILPRKTRVGAVARMEQMHGPAAAMKAGGARSG